MTDDASKKLMITLTAAIAALGVLGDLDVRAEDPAPLVNPSPDPPAAWITKAEQTDFRETPRYDETVEYCHRLAEASDWIDVQSCGTSPEGRDMPILILSKDKLFTPEEVHASDKLVVFVQNGIHAGECEGKDASLMLMRDIAVTKTRAGLLDHVVLIVMPIFNVDGHERFGPYSRINQNGPDEMGWRVTSRNLNLNRDYLKADTVEMRNWLRVWNAWKPDLHFDNHTTDGGDWQYDLGFATERHAVAPPSVVSWLDDTLYPALVPALEADGHLPITYFWLVDSKDPTKGIASGGFSPRYSTGYAAIRNRPSILVETHMLKPYRTRVFCHYNIMRRVLEIINANPAALRQAVQVADEQTKALGKDYDPQRKLPVKVKRTQESKPIMFKGFAFRRELSEVSGDVRIIYDNTKPVDFETVEFRKTEVSGEVTPPLGYIVPPQWTEVIDLAIAHGLRCERLVEPVTGEFESYRFEDVTFPARSFEGRFEPKYTTVPVVERRTYLPGSLVVRLDQPDAKVAVFLFEPEAPDSLVSWGFFNAIFEQKEYAEHYVMERIAREMLEASPEVRAAFEKRVSEDRKFAASPRARLNFFYRRSPWWDDHMNLYPIARITGPLTAKTEPVASGTR